MGNHAEKEEEDPHIADQVLLATHQFKELPRKSVYLFFEDFGLDSCDLNNSKVF